MKVSLIDVDGHNFPNLALMKLAAWHKANGDTVDWYSPLFSGVPDLCYASKVFSFTPNYQFYPDCEVRFGGTGFGLFEDLPKEIDNTEPDYSMYPEFKPALGFLSRGCVNKCPWCVVPKKEGNIRRYRDIETVAAGRKQVILMDNNFLANDDEFVKEQLTKVQRLHLKIDFNQAMDCRLVHDWNAELLTKCKWIKYIRFACDTAGQIEPLRAAITKLRKFGYHGFVFVYLLAKSFEDVYERLMKVIEMEKTLGYISPFVMRYRDFSGGGYEARDAMLLKLTHWCNRQWLRNSCAFEEYNRRK